MVTHRLDDRGTRPTSGVTAMDGASINGASMNGASMNGASMVTMSEETAHAETPTVIDRPSGHHRAQTGSGVSRRRRPVTVVVIVALLIAVVGCTAKVDEASRDGQGQTDEPGSGPDDGVPDWNDQTRIGDLGDGWTMAACDGDAPFLCIANRGMVVGTIETLRFPIASFPIVDTAADDLTNLHAIAADFTEALRVDRLVGCGPDYGFEALPTEPFTIGGKTGLSYGYIGTNPDGSPSETNLQYTSIQGDDILLIAAIAYDEGGCPGRDDLSGFDSATLVKLRSQIESKLRRMAAPSP